MKNLLISVLSIMSCILVFSASAVAQGQKKGQPSGPNDPITTTPGKYPAQPGKGINHPDNVAARGGKIIEEPTAKAEPAATNSAVASETDQKASPVVRSNGSQADTDGPIDAHASPAASTGTPGEARSAEVKGAYMEKRSRATQKALTAEEKAKNGREAIKKSKEALETKYRKKKISEQEYNDGIAKIKRAEELVNGVEAKATKIKQGQ